MSPWPFDRLLTALRPLCDSNDLLVQTGPSEVRLPCRTVRYLPLQEVLEEIRAADVVITHAGNTVRLAQRAGKVPIAVAREAARREMANDHQVDYLRLEEASGRVVAVWDTDALSKAVTAHPETEASIMTDRPLPAPVPGADVARVLDQLCRKWVR